jgi:RAP1 GTPase activating protein 1
VVRLDFDQVKAKHGKSIWSAPKLYVQALAPLVAERSNSEVVSLVQVPREHEGKAFQDLMKQEQQDRMRQYRFGVIRQKYGQVTEDEMLCNGSSDEFEEFLALLGERVHLRSHKGFKGGLNGLHNEFSYYRAEGAMEIMWHVAPFLQSEEDGCLGKKRYIGNDCVVIVFQDSACSNPFPAGCIVSKFVHVVIVVRPRGRNTYRVCVQQRDTVAPFGPPLPESASFVAGAGLSEFLISKCVLGEMAAFESTSFAPLVEQVKRRQLEGFRKSFTPNMQKAKALRLSDSKDMKK